MDKLETFLKKSIEESKCRVAETNDVNILLQKKYDLLSANLPFKLNFHIPLMDQFDIVDRKDSVNSPSIVSIPI